VLALLASIALSGAAPIAISWPVQPVQNLGAVTTGVGVSMQSQTMSNSTGAGGDIALRLSQTGGVVATSTDTGVQSATQSITSVAMRLTISQSSPR
jgi:glucose-6-phosphate dehydrogenase assembly protein OpcA